MSRPAAIQGSNGIPSPRRLTRGLPLGLALLTLGAPLSAWAEGFDPSRVGWTEAAYRAKKMGFSANTEVKLETLQATAVASELITSSEGQAVGAEGDELVVVSMRTRGLGQNSLARLFLQPGDGTILQRDQVDSGKKKRYRAYRYTAEGVYRLTRRPKSGEESQPDTSWSERDEHYDAYPSWAGDDLVVTEPGAIFYLAAAAALEKTGDVFQCPAYSRNKLLLVELKVLGSENIKVDYSVGGKRVKKTVSALRISIDASHLDPGSDESNMEFLGLRGDVELFLDPESRVPLAVTGRVPVAGKVTVRLQSVVLK